MKFSVTARDGAARTARIEFERGVVETPAFMPVGTRGTVKAVTPLDVGQSGARIVLGNTFHLMLRPGTDVIEAHGGLHEFMGWAGPILSDSGGFQVFSLSGHRKISESGVHFRSPVDGNEVFLGPEESMAIQGVLGSDIVMIFDECTPYPADEAQARISMELSLRWAERSRIAHGGSTAALFGIVQGGMHPQLRQESLAGLIELGFDGYAIGGLSVGEPKQEMASVLESLLPGMPPEQPRYLMGVGTPDDLIAAVARGVDMFDCVIPTRHARHGYLFTRGGIIRLRNTRHLTDTEPPDAACECYTCQNFSRAYLRHLDQCSEPLGIHLNTVHNLRFYQDLMAEMRTAIKAGNFAEFVARRYAWTGTA